MAVTMVYVTLLILACHVVLGSADYVGPMPEPDKSTLEALKAAVVNKGKFPSIECYGGLYAIQVPFKCDDSGRVISLVLADKGLGGSIAPEIGNLTFLTDVFIDNNQFSGSIPSSIGNLKSLQYLLLRRNQLSGSIPSTIGNLTSLIYLYLTNNQLSGSIPSSIGNLKSLERLFLNNNHLSGSIPSSIGNLNLTNLILGRNQLSGSIPSSITNLTAIMDIGLSSNQLSGSIPSSIGNLKQLGRFFIANNYFNGPVVRVNRVPTCISLKTNCFYNSSLPIKCAINKQRSISDCEAFCDATQPGGPCGGGGICSIGTNGPSCACNEGLSNQANKFTCK